MLFDPGLLPTSEQWPAPGGPFAYSATTAAAATTTTSDDVITSWGPTMSTCSCPRAKWSNYAAAGKWQRRKVTFLM